MSTYLEICQKVHTRAGYQGTLSSVSGTGYQATLVDLVSSAWVEIQNRRDSWKFLKASANITTQASKTAYTWGDIFPADPESYVSKWRYIIDSNQSYLRPLHHDRWVRDDVVNEAAGKPSKFSVLPGSETLLINPSDQAYTLTGYYYKKAQVLTNGTDVPLCPTEFQWAIVYQSLVDLGLFLGNSDLYNGYGVKASAGIRDLMRSQIPSSRVKTIGIV